MTYEEFLEFSVIGSQAEKCLYYIAYLLGFSFLLYLVVCTLYLLAVFLFHKLRLKRFGVKMADANLSAVPLKSCPMCGGEASVTYSFEKLGKECQTGCICCSSCKITTPNMLLVEAALKWNTRYAEDCDIVTLLEDNN